MVQLSISSALARPFQAIRCSQHEAETESAVRLEPGDRRLPSLRSHHDGVHRPCALGVACCCDKAPPLETIRRNHGTGDLRMNFCVFSTVVLANLSLDRAMFDLEFFSERLLNGRADRSDIVWRRNDDVCGAGYLFVAG